MKKDTHHSVKKVTLLIFVVFLLLGSLYYFSINNNNIRVQDINQSHLERNEQTYNSEFLKLSIDIPEKYAIVEKMNRISLNNNGKTITFNKTSTNSENLEDHLNVLELKNNIKFTNRKNIKIGNQDIIKTEVEKNEEPTTEKIYFYYPTEWTVYSISTSSPELYEDLDQIAQSFRYVE